MKVLDLTRKEKKKSCAEVAKLCGKNGSAFCEIDKTVLLCLPAQVPNPVCAMCLVKKEKVLNLCTCVGEDMADAGLSTSIDPGHPREALWA